MAKAKNKVISGDYEGKDVLCSLGFASISTGIIKSIDLDKKNISEYEVIDTDKYKSGASAVGKALVGNFFLGPIGLFAGLGAKNKGIFLIAVQFNDGKRSLLEVDEKVHKAIVKAMF